MAEPAPIKLDRGFAQGETTEHLEELRLKIAHATRLRTPEPPTIKQSSRPAVMAAIIVLLALLLATAIANVIVAGFKPTPAAPEDWPAVDGRTLEQKRRDYAQKNGANASNLTIPPTDQTAEELRALRQEIEKLRAGK